MMRPGSRAVTEVLDSMGGDVSLIPFPPECIPDAWRWLNEYPKANFDDYGPKTEREFADDLLRSVKSGQIIMGVRYKSVVVGIIGFQRLTPRLGHFSGICFSKAVHGRGIAKSALELLFKALWADGLEKVEAMFFADNQRIANLFSKLGGFSEGGLRRHTMRGGKPIDCRLVGFLRPEVN